MKNNLFVTNHAPSFYPFRRTVESRHYWKWGNDNLLPDYLAAVARRSTAHRRIINDKADYIAGKGFVCDQGTTVLETLIEKANGYGQSLGAVIKKLATDKCLFGNAFLEIVTDRRHRFLSLFHQDASRCRVAKDSRSILLHADWTKFQEKEARAVALYPHFTEDEKGYLHAMIHYKDYEPQYRHYGVPPYIAGLDASEIAHKTDRWNMARLENAFQLSGIMILDGDVETDMEAAQLSDTVRRKFAGHPGQVMFVVKNSSQNENSKFIPIASANDGDWKALHEQAQSDIILAHSWFRTLSGLNYSSGLSSDRIVNEYHIALDTVILPHQKELLEPIKNAVERLLGTDASSLSFVNKPPLSEKPAYMRIWEARKADGLAYDPQDPDQQRYISQL